MNAACPKNSLIVRVASPRNSVSQVLRALPRDDIENLLCHTHASSNRAVVIHVANDRASRETAYRLAYRVYERSGYATESQAGMCVSPFDAHPRTLTLLAKGPDGVPVATVSTVYDSPLGLPCDEVYHQEISSRRKQGQVLAEVTRLAIDCDPGSARGLLLDLFNCMYLFTRFTRCCRHLVVEVNPRHAGYYRRLLMFECIGPLRNCPRVKGAPAVLMSLDLERLETAVKRSRAGLPNTTKTKYPYGYSPGEESRIVRALSAQFGPMSEGEARHFGILESYRSYRDHLTDQTRTDPYPPSDATKEASL